MFLVIFLKKKNKKTKNWSKRRSESIESKEKKIIKFNGYTKERPRGEDQWSSAAAASAAGVRGGLITPKSRIPSYKHNTERERESQSQAYSLDHIQNSAGVHNRFQTCKWLEFGMPFDSISMVNVTGQGIWIDTQRPTDGFTNGAWIRLSGRIFFHFHPIKMSKIGGRWSKIKNGRRGNSIELLYINISQWRRPKI